jgi:hypothetical protein
MDTIKIRTEVSKEMLTENFEYFESMLNGKFSDSEANVDFEELLQLINCVKTGIISNNLHAFYGYKQRKDYNKIIKLDSDILRQINNFTDTEEGNFTTEIISETVLPDKIPEFVLTRLRDSFYNNIANKFDLAIAGGYLTGEIVNNKMWEDSDVDFFFIGTEKVTKEKVKEIVDYIIQLKQSTDKMSYYITENAVTVSCKNYKIQIILKQYNTIDNLLNSFDINCCKIALYKNRFYSSLGAINSLIWKTNVITKDTKWSSQTTKRYLKYLNRGFSIKVLDGPEDIVTKIRENIENIYMVKLNMFYYKISNKIVYGVYDLVLCNKQYLYFRMISTLQIDCTELIEDFYTADKKYSQVGFDCRGKDIEDIWGKFEVKVINYNKPMEFKINTFECFF